MPPKRPRASASSPGGGSSGGDSPSEHDEDEVQQHEPAAAGAGAGAASSAWAPDPEEEDDGEELIGDDMADDYRPMGALDEYEADGIDEGDYGMMDFSARAAADAALDARDGRERASRMPAALLTSDDDGEDRPQRRRRRAEAEADAEDPAAGLDQFLDDEESGINLEDYTGSLSEWIASAAVSEEVKRRFKRFLRNSSSDGAST